MAGTSARAARKHESWKGPRCASETWSRCAALRRSSRLSMSGASWKTCRSCPRCWVLWQRLTVHKVAHKVCDTISRSGMRRMTNAVHLTSARCDGSAHGGCQTACSFLLEGAMAASSRSWSPVAGRPSDPRRVSAPLIRDQLRKDPGPDGRAVFLPGHRAAARRPDMPAIPGSRPVRPGRGRATPPCRRCCGRSGSVSSTAFTRRQIPPRRLWFRAGCAGASSRVGGGPNPTASSTSKPGELVRIKSKEEILATLDENLLNRGMGFDEEMSRFCGQIATVQSRVERCIDEKTGRMLTMKNPCIILENIFCAGRYNVSARGSLCHSGGRSGSNECPPLRPQEPPRPEGPRKPTVRRTVDVGHRAHRTATPRTASSAQRGTILESCVLDNVETGGCSRSSTADGRVGLASAGAPSRLCRPAVEPPSDEGIET